MTPFRRTLTLADLYAQIGEVRDVAFLLDAKIFVSRMVNEQMTDEEKKPYLIKQGDILFNRTNSKELVGKANVFNLPGEYVFASYLIRVRLKKGTLLPDYVTAFLSSLPGRIQIDAISRQIAGMTNINAEEIRELLIPAPSEVVQKKVVQAWQAAIQNRDQTFDKARSILATIDDVPLSKCPKFFLGTSMHSF